jgi:methionyl-tRNA synthetase
LDSARRFGETKPGAKVVKGEALFPRIDVEKELKQLEENKTPEVKVEEKKETPENVVDIAEITIDEFAKVDLRVAKVLTAEKVEKADKLLKMTMDVGGKERTVVSGIAKYYTPEDMVGRNVVLVANLKPAKLRGIMSEGMILCASDDEGNLVLISPVKDIKSGSEVR